MNKTKRNWLLSRLLAILMLFGLCLGFGLNSQVQTVHATGGEPNPNATSSQISSFNGSITGNQGITFADGVLTITSDYSHGSDYDDPAGFFIDTGYSQNVDFTIVINKNPCYLVAANFSGNLTIVANSNVYVYELYASENLTIKGQGILNMVNYAGSFSFNTSHFPTKYSLAYAKEKLSIEEDVLVSCLVPSFASARSAVCAKSIEINNENRIGLIAENAKGEIKQAPIVFHSCNSADDLAGKLVINKGALGLGKYYNTEDAQYNDYFGFVGYTSSSDGSITNYDTENKAFTGYEIVETETALIVKTRSVDFEENGAAGDFVRWHYLPIKTEPITVTLPACPYTAPEGKHFAGWALGSKTATPLKQPGDTFALEDGGHEYSVGNYYDNYYNIYAIWEDDAPEINYINEIRITSTTTSVVEGALPAFTASTTTEHAEIAQNGNTIWLYWNENENQWYGFGTGDKVAVAGTRYGLRLCCDLESGYEFGDNVTIYFNGQDWTSVGHSRVQKVAAWGGFVMIDLGEAIPTYFVTYYANGSESFDHDEGKIPAGTYTLKTIDELSFVAPSGKQFKGWAYTSNGEIITTTTITLDGDTELYAIWEDIPAQQYTITFNSNGGSGTMKGVGYAGTYTLPACTFTAPDGKEFDGWALSADGEKITTAQITISENTELFAIWRAVQYTITVTYGTASANLAPAGTTITLTANAPEEGYEFDKWVGEGVTFSDENNETTTFVMPAVNVTITATYKSIPVDPETPEQPENPETPAAPETPSANENKGLSAGAVVGIVLGVVAVGGLGGLAIVWFVIRKKTFADLIAAIKRK